MLLAVESGVVNKCSRMQLTDIDFDGGLLSEVVMMSDEKKISICLCIMNMMLRLNTLLVETQPVY